MEHLMPFSKSFTRGTLPLLLISVFGQLGVWPAVADDNTAAAGKSSDDHKATTTTTASGPSSAGAAGSATDLATRPVNEKILPIIKEGYGYLSRGAYDKAIKALQKAVSLDKDCISARRYLAYALIQKGRAKEALTEMQTVSKLVPPNAFDFYLFAAAYYAAGGVKEAKDCYVEALRQNPAYDAARAGLVKTLARQHNFDEALNNVQQGLQLAKDESVKRYYASLSKAVVEAQTYQQQSANGIMPGDMSSLAAQTGGGSVKSQPVVIK
jgi:tetratricopeptide (TPR) repeat protein